MTDTTNQLHVALAALNAQNSDVFLYIGAVARDACTDALDIIRNRPNRRERLTLLLGTYGGDPDAAYLLARGLRRLYAEVVILVGGPCKSAGTLITFGATEVVMDDFGELGPVDMQVRRKDEYERESGLTPQTALNALVARARTDYIATFLDLRSRLALTTKVASEMASSLVISMYSPVAAQVDPMRFAELERAIDVILAYGKRLAKSSKAISEAKVREIVTTYPDHGFIIDYDEAVEQFERGRVRRPSDVEADLLTIWRPLLRDPPSKNNVIFKEFLDPPTTVDTDAEGGTDDANEQESGGHASGTQDDAPGAAGEPDGGTVPAGSEANDGAAPAAKPRRRARPSD